MHAERVRLAQIRERWEIAGALGPGAIAPGSIRHLLAGQGGAARGARALS